MRILVVSDTHGQRAELKEVISKTRPFDYLIHCGDTEGLRTRSPGKPPALARSSAATMISLPT